MKRSEALKQAQERYTAKRIKTVGLRFNIENDADVLSKLATVDNMTDYVRRLIRKDMEGKK